MIDHQQGLNQPKLFDHEETIFSMFVLSTGAELGWGSDRRPDVNQKENKERKKKSHELTSWTKPYKQNSQVSSSFDFRRL